MSERSCKTLKPWLVRGQPWWHQGPDHAVKTLSSHSPIQGVSSVLFQIRVCTPQEIGNDITKAMETRKANRSLPQ